MPYALIPLIVSVVLGARYVAMGDTSRWSKAVVVVVVAGSLLIWWKYPEWLTVATIAQVAVSIYVLIYLKVNPYAV